MNDSFWKFPAHVKWDKITERSHPRLVTGALQDRTTGAEIIGSGKFILYGEEEALLFEPESRLFRVVMYLYCGLCTVLGKNSS